MTTATERLDAALRRKIAQATDDINTAWWTFTRCRPTWDLTTEGPRCPLHQHREEIEAHGAP